MSSLVTIWIDTNYPGSTIADATRTFLLAQTLALLEADFSYCATPDLWSLYLTDRGFIGPLSQQFEQLYAAEGHVEELRNPFYAVVGITP